MNPDESFDDSIYADEIHLVEREMASFLGAVPAMDAESTPALLDFKLLFTATDEPVKYEDPMMALHDCHFVS